jgi:hypothetical protein
MIIFDLLAETSSPVRKKSRRNRQIDVAGPTEQTMKIDLYFAAYSPVTFFQVVRSLEKSAAMF